MNEKKGFIFDCVRKSIPPTSAETLANYVYHGLPPGNFLRALLANDLQSAFRYADLHNRDKMQWWALVVHLYCPGDCHGSYEIVDDWIDSDGIEGQDRRSN
jgi:hypothetical protein